MPRPLIKRCVGALPRSTFFKPAGVPAQELEQLVITLDEFEAIRLVDREGLSHEQAAAAMGVSRQTVGRVIERARGKVAEALVAGKAISIEGGQYRVVELDADECGCGRHQHHGRRSSGGCHHGRSGHHGPSGRHGRCAPTVTEESRREPGSHE